MQRREWLTAVLLLALLALVPLAYATPPDQSWLGGWYDDGDHDDVVVAVTSAVATVGPILVFGARRVARVATIIASASSIDTTASDFLPGPQRAPPFPR